MGADSECDPDVAATFRSERPDEAVGRGNLCHLLPRTVDGRSVRQGLGVSGRWRDLTISPTGETHLDGELISDAVDSFGAAVALVRDAARSAGTPLLVRVADEATGEQTAWFEVDGEGTVSAVHAPQEGDDDHPEAFSPVDLLFTAAASPELDDPVGPGYPRVRSSRGRIGRKALVVCALGVALLAGAVWVGAPMMNAAARGLANPTPNASVVPTVPGVVALPGFETESAWSVRGVGTAAAAASRVIAVSGSTVSLRDARSGDVLATAELVAEQVDVVAGFAAGAPALAAVSDVQALVWVGEAVEPVVIDLTGERWLTTRTGALVVVGADWSFELVTAAGAVPVTSPRPEMVVLGVADRTVVWAGAPHQVVFASPNGTLLREVTLAAPDSAATITPKVGWVRAATASTVVVGWTLPDGSALTGVHSAGTGELLAQIAGTGAGFLSADATTWAVDGYVIDLASSTQTALPEGFIAARFLAGDLYGALATGDDALLSAGESAAKAVKAPTVRPFAIADGTLLTLTNGVLASYPETH